MKKKYFITGGTGSFAKKFIELLISNKAAEKIIIFSRDEFKQMQMKELPFVKNNISKFRFFIGDVRDRDRLDWALQEEIDVVVHTAALKQVPTTEYNPFETVKTNIIGSQNLIEVSLRKNIDKIISTMKYIDTIVDVTIITKGHNKELTVLRVSPNIAEQGNFGTTIR